MKLEAAREEERKVGAKSTHKYLMPAQAGGKSAKPQWTPSLPSNKWSTQLEQKGPVYATFLVVTKAYDQAWTGVIL